MGTVSKVISILVLVFAIASAALSFLLFQKREVLVKGWDKMSSCISSTAKELDKGSGTNIGVQMTADAMSHKKYEDLDKVLAALPKEAQQVVEQRNTLAKGIKEIAGMLDIGDAVQENELTELAKYKDKNTEFIGQVKKVQDKNNAFVTEIVACGKNAGLNLDAKALKNVASYKAEMQKLTAKFNATKVRMQSYENCFRDIAGAISAKAPDLQNDDYSKYLSDLLNSSKDLKKNLDQTNKALEAEKARVNDLNSSIAKRESIINDTNKSIKDKDSEIAKLNQHIKTLTGAGEGSGGPTTILDSNDPETLKLVKGKIIEVNKKWDFVVINLGAKTKVVQKLGQKEHEIELTLPVGEEMVIAKNLQEGMKSEFAGKLKIVKAYENCCIGNILPNAKGTTTVSVGDTVFFDDATIAKIADKSKKKDEPAAAAPGSSAALTGDKKDPKAETAKKKEEAKKILEKAKKKDDDEDDE